MAAGQRLSEEKRALRAALLERRRAASRYRVDRVGMAIAEALSEARAFRSARVVALYAAAGGEPDLTPLFDVARRADKTVLFPRCGERRQLTFHAVRSLDALVEGRYGLAEPLADAERLSLAEADLVLVPAVAVDRRGARLGRGAGWYDRALPHRDGPAVLAAVHAFQIVPRVPAGPEDRAVDGWVSEQGLGWV